MTTLAYALQLLFGGIFLGTGVTKLVRLAYVEVVLVQLVGFTTFERIRVDSRRAALALALFEIALGASLMLGWDPARYLLLATMLIFVGVVVRAWRLHVDCGCFPDRRPSEVASIARTTVLTALAFVVARSGLPGPRGQGLVPAVLLAAGVGAGVYAGYAVIRALGARHAPAVGEPMVTHVVLVNQIVHHIGGREVPPDRADADGWIPVPDAAQLAHIAVSRLLGELSRSARPAAGRLLPIGSRPAFAVTTLTGQERRWDRLPGRRLLMLFSATCTRCPTHIDAVRDVLTQSGTPTALVIVAGPTTDAAKYVDAFGGLAEMALVGMDDELIDNFAIVDFPAFYVINEDGRVAGAATHIDDLTVTTT